jgi:hypothetical protein
MRRKKADELQISVDAIKSLLTPIRQGAEKFKTDGHAGFKSDGHEVSTVAWTGRGSVDLNCFHLSEDLSQRQNHFLNKIIKSQEYADKRITARQAHDYSRYRFGGLKKEHTRQAPTAHLSSGRDILLNVRIKSDGRTEMLRSLTRKGPPPVVETLDIFIKMEDGTYVWKASAETFEVATSKVEQLATVAPGDYIIFDQNTGNEIVVIDGLPIERALPPEGQP